MFRPLYAYGNPLSLAVAPTITFRPGMIGQLDATSTIILTDGTFPIGFLDDNKLTTYHRKIVDEAVVLTGVVASNLLHSNLTALAFKVTNAAGTIVYTNIADYTVNIVNGTIQRTALSTIVTGATVLVTYEYQLPTAESVSSQPSGSDDTAGSGKVAVWNAAGIYGTDQYDVTRTYAVNECLYALAGIVTNSNAGISGTPCVIGRVHRVPAATGGAPTPINPERAYNELLEVELWAHCCSL